jgi:lipopolysaccharide export system permease protein
MKTLDRYLAATIGLHFLSALAVLLAIFSIISFMDELGDVGTGDYGLGEAMWFVFLTLPNEAYRLTPAAALLGTVTGLGGLASAHEIIAMGAAGISPARLSRSALQAAAGMMLAALLLGELVAAPLVRKAQGERSSALSGGLALGTASGFWARDGTSFVNARALEADGTLRGLYIFDFDADRRMTRFTYAERAVYAGGQWTLESLTDSRFSGDTAVTRRLRSAVWDSHLKPRQLSFLSLSPEDLSLGDLDRSLRSLRERSESSDREQLAFWRRLTWPLLTAVMVYLALPFVLGSFGRATLGKRVAVGALVGVGFQMVNEAFGTFALGAGLDARVCALLPAAAALAAGVWAMQRER